jgi:putative phosphoesterase
MRIAILADIHGNIIALEAVLKDLARQGNADYIFVSGDLFAFGAASDEVLPRLRELPGARFLLGNTDRYLLNRTYPSMASSNGWRDTLLLSFRWTAEQMGDEGLEFLKSLPASHKLAIDSFRLLAVHGSPRSDEEGLTLETGAGELKEMLPDRGVSVLTCGHTHIPMDRLLGGVRVINVGSVGLPFDGDPRACYALLTFPQREGSPTQVDLRRVAYDVEAAVDQFYARRHPAADISAYNLRTAHSIGSSLIYTPEMRAGVRV